MLFILPPAPKPLVVYGAAGHAKVVFDIVRRQGVYQVVSVFDRYKPIGTPCGSLVVSGTMEELPEMLHRCPDLEAVVAIGDNWARARITLEILQLCPAIRFGLVIHPSAQIGADVTIGAGTVVAAGAIISPSAKVGGGCLLNTGSSLDHDSVRGHFSSLAPAAAVGGGVRIGAYTSVGIGASVIQEITIGEHVVVGAGAVVVRDIPDSVVAYGVPARAIHERQIGERYLGDATAAGKR